MDSNILDGDVLMNEVEINLVILHALVMNEVDGEVDRVVDNGTPGERVVELLQELEELGRLGHTIRHHTIFGLDARAGDYIGRYFDD